MRSGRRERRRLRSASSAGPTSGSPSRRATDHRAAIRLAQVRVAAGQPVDELPEAVHVLAQLAHDQIAAVAAEVGAVGRVLGARQARPGERAASSSGRSV